MHKAGERLRLVAVELMEEITKRFEQPWRHTAEMFAEPAAGMRFHEFFAFWAHVMRVDTREDGDARIIVEEYNAPCEVPGDARVKMFPSKEAFRRRYAYGNKDEGKYFVTYTNGSCGVSHWLTEQAQEQADKMEAGKVYRFVFSPEDEDAFVLEERQ